MNRCPRSSSHPLLAFVLCTALAGTALLPTVAQAQRIFPNTAKRGEITFVHPPHEVLLNGQPERLAVGVRVVDIHNRVPLAGSLRGNTYIVNYVRDPAGKVRQVWLLTEKEAARPGKPEVVRLGQPMRVPDSVERDNHVPGGIYSGN